MTHLGRHAALQFAALFTSACLLWPFNALNPISDYWLALAGLSSSAALVFAIASRAPWWWRCIHPAFPLLLYVAAHADIDPLIYLQLLALCVLLFPGAITDRVPLFRSNLATLQLLHNHLAQRPLRHLIELGAGLGDVPCFLAPRLPEVRFTCYETAPLSYLIGRWRTRHFANVRWHFRSLWQAELQQADAIYAFLSPVPMPALWDKCLSETASGTELISNTFPVPDLVPQLTLSDPDNPLCRTLYCYQTPEQTE